MSCLLSSCHALPFPFISLLSSCHALPFPFISLSSCHALPFPYISLSSCHALPFPFLSFSSSCHALPFPFFLYHPSTFPRRFPFYRERILQGQFSGKWSHLALAARNSRTRYKSMEVERKMRWCWKRRLWWLVAFVQCW